MHDLDTKFKEAQLGGLEENPGVKGSLPPKVQKAVQSSRYSAAISIDYRVNVSNQRDTGLLFKKNDKLIIKFTLK